VAFRLSEYRFNTLHFSTLAGFRRNGLGLAAAFIASWNAKQATAEPVSIRGLFL
jgi:hypothetical protein